METKLSLKLTFFKKVQNVVSPYYLLYISNLAQTLLFPPLGRVNTECAPRAASHAAGWGPLGGQRTANGLQMSPKCLRKIVKNRPPVPECAPRAPKVPPSLQKAQFLIKSCEKLTSTFHAFRRKKRICRES